MVILSSEWRASASSLTRISTVTEQKAMSHAHQKMAWSLDES